MRGKVIGAKQERTLVGARRLGKMTLHLQCNTQVVVRLAIGHVDLQRARERVGCSGPVAPREVGATERAQDSRVGRRCDESAFAKRHRSVGVAGGEGSTRRREPRLDVARRRGEGRLECGAHTRSTVLAQRNAREVVRRRKPGLHLEHARVSRERRGAVALLVCAHGAGPQAGQRGAIERAIGRAVARFVQRCERGDERISALEDTIDQRLRVRQAQRRERPDLPPRPLREHRPRCGLHSREVDQNVGILSGDCLRRGPVRRRGQHDAARVLR